MRSVVQALLVITIAATAPGCATIVGGGSNQTVRVESSPVAASYVIRASNGLQMGAGQTPSTVRLPRKNEYSIEVSLAGYHPQTTALSRGTNGWIWGNLFVGWLLGFGIDFLTGSAHKLEPTIVSLSLAQVADDTYAVLKFFDGSKLIDEERLKLRPIQ